ncbi:hypothetical protein KXD40_008043 [Peronospora effusa]|uniref:RanBD1 domain-containing protein n=1 Tax=Peronospora effusa TaxID=542832 RepID=A0A3R7W643_9STRA|nr:hypothetical protein DD237_000964 [Peronospora effusa]UIZ24082.1 hypothetical protein KXD40_008043 [Peronospora effusa]CAI5714982.1 unnamed protein product [Peronospora effusa]
MATKGDHEKPETVDNEHQPIIKKVRLDVTEEVKKVKIDENATPQPEIGGSKIAVEKDLSASTSPVTENQEEEENVSQEKEEEVKVLTTGSAFGGFSSFCGEKKAFTLVNSSGFGPKASDSSFGGIDTEKSSKLDDETSLSSLSDTTTSSSSGFALFQSNSSATFASFAATQSTTEGFGAMASSSLSTDFLDTDVMKRADPVVPALSEAELANGEEGEQILIEKRAKLFKLVEKDYAEVGIGPLRVLKAKDTKTEEDKATARIVMRRESYPHGHGTKLLMNASLGSCLQCEQKTEKTMLLTVLEANEDLVATKKFIPVTYLMRFGSPDDLDVVSAQIQANMHSSTAPASSN